MCSNPVRNNFHRKCFIIRDTIANILCFTVPTCLFTTFQSQRCNGCVPVFIFQGFFPRTRREIHSGTHLLSYVSSLPIFFYPSPPPPPTIFYSSFFFSSFLSTLSSSTFSCLLCYMDSIEAFSTKKRSHEGRTVRMRFSSLTVTLMSITSRLSHRCYVCERETGPRNRIGFSIFRRSLPAYIVHTCKNMRI